MWINLETTFIPYDLKINDKFLNITRERCTLINLNYEVILFYAMSDKFP